MTDMFEGKTVSPMLIGERGEAFDDPDYLFELNLDGLRCIAYLDPLTGTSLLNKQGAEMLGKVPELGSIHKQVDARCILDGELIVATDGEPGFREIQRRSQARDRFEIYLQSSLSPATFVASDILYYGGKETTSWTTVQRKELLERAVVENERLMVARYVEARGVNQYSLASSRNLNGIVAKRKECRYYPGTRCRDWVYIRNPQDDDYVACGYAGRAERAVRVVLGQYDGERLIFRGQAALSMSAQDFKVLSLQDNASGSAIQPVPPGCEDAVWLAPNLVVTVRYMDSHARQPEFRGFRMDVEPKECAAGPVAAGILIRS